MAEDQDLNTLLDSLAQQVDNPEQLADAVALLKKRALERMLEEEMAEHLGYNRHEAKGRNSGNSRNGQSHKTVLTDTGTVELDVPRDRDGSFEPQVVQKRQRRLKGFDDKLISLYARGLTTREIQGHIAEIYGVDVSPSLISRVTDGVLEEVEAWQRRALEPMYPVVYFDGFVLKVRHDGVVRNRTVYVVLALTLSGQKEVLGLWMANNEGAKFWLAVLNELKSRGLQDILIASVDGLSGFPDALEASFPNVIVQTCIVHQIRNSLRLVAWKTRRSVARDLKPVYQASTEEEALSALDDFEASWSAQYPSIGASWRARWALIRPFFEFSPEIRRIIYTTNPIEALNRQLRKVTKTRGAFPSEDAAFKLLWLAIDRASQKWTRPPPRWDLVLQQLAIHFPGRVSLEAYAQR